jgi:hypothetical protein
MKSIICEHAAKIADGKNGIALDANYAERKHHATGARSRELFDVTTYQGTRIKGCLVFGKKATRFIGTITRKDGTKTICKWIAV